MLDLYEWLFETYAMPEIYAIYEGQDDILEEFARQIPLPQKQRLRLVDLAGNMRLQWGTESFALGVRFGMQLAAPRVVDEDCKWMLKLFPQLDNPVA